MRDRDAASEDAPWLREWEPVDAVVRSGGEGSVIRVRSRADGTLGALKTLHAEVTASERRGRMAAEVTALARVAGPGVPRLLAHNAEAISTPGTPLYYVVE